MLDWLGNIFSFISAAKDVRDWRSVGADPQESHETESEPVKYTRYAPTIDPEPQVDTSADESFKLQFVKSAGADQFVLFEAPVLDEDAGYVLAALLETVSKDPELPTQPADHWSDEPSPMYWLDYDDDDNFEFF